MDVQAALGSCVSANNKTTWRVMNASITREIRRRRTYASFH